ncbi:MAG: hypothetical protein J6S13_09180 [Clostridia bacterium]|nr:hypothetical protein [Clostridia bacterium]
MNYRKDFWYILGLALVALTVIIMAVSMIFMYYGSAAAILWFFGSSPVLVAGVFLMRGTARRYDEPDAETGEPLPAFWQIRYAFHNLKVLVITRDKWRSFLTVLTVLLLISTVILSGVCIYSKFASSAVTKDPNYNQNIDNYEMSRSEWEKARDNGDTEAQQKHFLAMQDAQDRNYKYRQRIETYDQRVKDLFPWSIVSATATVMCSIIMFAYIKHKKEIAN